MTKYFVMACKECESAWVVQGRSKTVSCSICGEVYEFSKLKKLFTTEDKDKAKQARALKQAELHDLDMVFEDFIEKGLFDDDVERAIGGEEYLEKKGIDTSAIGDGTPSSGSVSKKERILSIIDDQTEPTDETVADEAEQYGISEETVFEIIDGLCRDGDVIRERGGTLRRI